MKDKLKAIWRLWKSEEYFLTVANRMNNIEPWRGPVKYEYMTNSNRNLFYTFIKDYINNLELNKKLSNE